MAGGAGGDSRELDQTPTWAVASVCAVILLVSIALEKVLHHIGEWFTERRKKALVEALEKVKAELMILGFISLLLTFLQNYIAKICISEKLADTMLPCELKKKDDGEGKDGAIHRRLLWDLIANVEPNRRVLAAAVGNTCKEGKVPFVSTNGIHQLHIFIFFLAIFHVAYTALTMALGRLKIRGWKEWEKETLSLDYEFSNDPSRFRFAHETSFVRQHSSIWDKFSILLYIMSFFRQFFWSVRKEDYLTMRHGFINAHLAPGSKFDFQRYIKRSLEDDFKVVVSISPLLWASSVVFLLLNVHGWQTLFWLSLVPLCITLAVGTKLQAIISKMALEIKERHVVVQGMPVVQLSDQHFWFRRPGLILVLIHFTLFQNAFQIIYFLWIWYSFGLRSCFNKNTGLLIARICLGVGVQFLCSYVTLPLYALVSQMGTHMKRSIFDEQTNKALKKWHQAVKKKHGKSTHHAARTPGESPSVSPNASPVHQLQRFMTTGHAKSGFTKTRRRYLSDNELSDTDQDIPSSSPTTPILGREPERSDQGPPPVEHRLEIQGPHGNPEDDFSFAKPAPASR